MPNPKFVSIEEIGFPDYLNNTIDEHNGHGYDSWCELVKTTRHPSGKVNKAALARIFGKDERTIGYWLKIYNKEQKNG